MTKRVAVFFDVQNLYHSSKNFGGSKISYKHLLDEIVKGRAFAEATAYTAHKDENSSRAFYDALRKSDINVVSRRVFTKQEPGGGRRVIPVHFDVEIATDAKSLPNEVDVAVLCTGNGNFAYLAESLYDDGLEVEVWSFSESTSDLLKSNKKIKFVQIPKEALLSGVKKEESKTDA